MSYILEALKKSQQERDLGQVPTLETLPAMTESGPSRINHWGVAAVVLAGLAVVIALYAALRAVPTREDSVPVATVPAQPASAAVSVVPDPVRELPQPAPVSSQVPVGEGAQPGVIDEFPPERSSSVPPQAREPVREPAQPERRPSPPPRPAAVTRPEDKIPEDLRQEIETFKQNLRNEKADRRKQADAALPPHKLRLPREVEERLPASLMTGHIYDKEPAKRFVLINARKLREGEQTRQGIFVEEILPSGVVLSYEGHRFFRHR